MTTSEKGLWEIVINRPHVLGNILGYDKLTDIHSKWIKDCWDVNYDNVLMAHRNSYKTTAVIVVGAIRRLLINPEDRILITRKIVTDSSAILTEITKHYEGNTLKAIYNKLRGIKNPIRKNNLHSLTLNTKRRITKEGNIEVIGVGGAVTGRHYEKVVADDIVTIKDRIYRSEREYTKSFCRELKNIPVFDGNIIYTGTPWHPEDAFSILPEANKYRIGSVEIPELTAEKIADLKKGMTPALWAANYELKHIADEGRIFTEAQYSDWKNDYQPLAHLDPAYQGSNTTALTLCFFDKKTGFFYITGWVWRKDVTELYEIIRNLLIEYKAGTLIIESNADKGLSVKDMKKIYPAVEGEYERENKHIKIISYLKKNWSRVYISSTCQGEYINQILDYQEGQEPDDAPDSASAIIRKIVGKATNIMERY